MTGFMYNEDGASSPLLGHIRGVTCVLPQHFSVWPACRVDDIDYSDAFVAEPGSS